MHVAVSSVKRSSNANPSLVKNSTEASGPTARLRNIFLFVMASFLTVRVLETPSGVEEIIEVIRRRAPGMMCPCASRSSTAPSETATTVGPRVSRPRSRRIRSTKQRPSSAKSQFDVVADGRLLFSKQQQGRWPEVDEILSAL